MAAARSDRPDAGAALSDEAYEALSIESATVVPRASVWKRLANNWSVRIGGVLLALLVLIAVAAPLLGTVAASFSTTEEVLMMPSPSRSHCTTAPPTKTLPPIAYSVRPSSCHATVVSSLCCEILGSVPMFISMKQPVP